MTESSNGQIKNMNEEELARYIVEILESSLIEEFDFKQYSIKDKGILTEWSMKSKSGWNITNKDMWEE